MEYQIYKPIKYNKESNLIGYLDNTLLKPRPFYETGIAESLENIILQDDPEKERSIVEKIFSDKGRTLKATIKALFNELLLRQNLNYKLLDGIDSDICKTGSYLEQIRFFTQRQYTPDLEIAFSRRRTQLENQVVELEKEKRQEYLTCWKDLMFLKKYLLSALKDYWTASNRKSFLDLENDGGYRRPVQETQTYNWD
jgi:hypothetical protein